MERRSLGANADFHVQQRRRLGRMPGAVPPADGHLSIGSSQIGRRSLDLADGLA
jgi:hypothetical protein